MDNEKIKNFITKSRADGVPDAEIFKFLDSKGVVPKEVKSQVTKAVSESAANEYAKSGTKLEQFSTGVAKGVLSTVKGAGKLGEGFANLFLPEKFEATTYRDIEKSAEEGNIIAKVFSEETLKPRTGLEKLGKTTEQIAEFFVPAGKVAQVEKVLATTATKNVTQKLIPIVGENIASKIGSAAELGTKATIRAAEGAGVTALQTGGEGDATKDAAIISAIFPVAGKGVDVIKQYGKDFAPRIVNSLIKPLAKELSYGKNPGRAIAEEGITATSLDDLVTKVAQRKQEIGSEIGDVVSKIKDKVSDATNITQPLDEAIASANKSPKTNAALIGRLEALKDDLFSGKNLKNMTTEEIFNLKTQVSELTKFTGNASDDALVNKSLKRIYGELKGLVNENAKGLKSKSGKTIEELNERYADLSSAEIATKYRSAVAERANIISLPSNILGLGSGIVAAIASGGAAVPALLAGAGGIALEKAMASPMVKTRVASWLAKASPAEKQKLFSAVPAMKGAIIKLFVGE